MSTVAVHHVVTGPADAPVVVLSNSLCSTISAVGGIADDRPGALDRAAARVATPVVAVSG